MSLGRVQPPGLSNVQGATQGFISPRMFVTSVPKRCTKPTSNQCVHQDSESRASLSLLGKVSLNQFQMIPINPIIIKVMKKKNDTVKVVIVQPPSKIGGWYLFIFLFYYS